MTEPLVVCGICESVTEKANAEWKLVDTPEGPQRGWLCKSCLKLGTGDAVHKYIMKQEKKIGRQKPEH